MGLIKDAKSIAERDPAARSTLEVILLYPGFHALVYHKISRGFYRMHMFFMARWVSQICSRRTGIEIHPGATIGEGLFIDHGKGVVVGETAVIGNNCTIYHQVTLGGTGHTKHKKRHPTVGNNVLIGAGSKILGPVTIGDNAMIGAGSVVVDDVPAGTTVTGVKAKIIKINGEKVIPSEELNQKTDDPFQKELSQIRDELSALKEELRTLKEETGNGEEKENTK